MLTPQQTAPSLSFQTVAHGPYDLAEGAPPAGTLVSFHRGEHCKLSRNHVKELDDRIGDFAIRGLRVVAASTEDAASAARLVQGMQIIRLPVGYGLDPAVLQAQWGLFLTEGQPGTTEPALFAEPGVFWLRRDGVIGLCGVQSAPHLRPDATAILRAVDAVMKAPGTGAHRL